MSSLVCNCNSYGNIDYGVPILFKSSDFRTSTAVGLKNIAPKFQEFYSLKPYIPIEATEKLIEPHLDTFKTHNSVIHDRKHQKWDANGAPNLAPGSAKIHHMRTFKEKIFQNPVAPRKHGITEYKSGYQFKHVEDTSNTVQNVVTQTTCAISSTGEQPRIETEKSGVTKLLDPYLTTTNLSYVPFTPNQLEISRKHITTYYDSNALPQLKSHDGKKSMNDDSLFKAHIKGSLVPQLVYRVPFSGKTSEYTGNYRPPTIGCLASRTFDSGTEFPDSLSDASPWQNLAPPNMYCTEYCHIGTGWPVRATVYAKNDDPVQLSKHTACC